jgi:hypothetical protein
MTTVWSGWPGAIRRAGTVATVVVVVLAAGACASKSESSAARTGAAPAPDRATAESGGGGSADASAPGVAKETSFKADALVGPAAQPVGSFISTATMTVEVDDVAAVKPRVVSIAQAAGGGLFGEETTYGAKSRSVITVKVPPPAFTQVLQDLGALGTLATQQVKTDDVTQQVIDLEARIAASSASLDRTRDLLGQAKTLTDVAYLEGEVARRQADLESLKGQQKTLRGRIDLATVVVTLDGQHDATPAERERRPEPAALPGFMDGLRGGWDVATTVASVAAAVVGAAVPFLPLIALAVLGLRFLRRRRGPVVVAPPAVAPAGP